MKYETSLKSELKRISKIIIEKYKPLTIIVFGSIANTHVTEESDIDLVVIKDTYEKFIDRSISLVKLTDPEEPIDFLVYTPEEIEMAKRQNNHFIINEILKKGKIVFKNGVFYEL